MIGRVLSGRYEVLGLLAESPVFVSFSGRDLQTKRDVTIRIVQLPFRNETAFCLALGGVVRNQQSVRSPQVETITEVGQDGDQTYLISSLTRSPTLAERIKKLAPFSIAVAVTTAISICRAADSVHRAGLAHGDLNPHNVLMLGDGEVKVQLVGFWDAYNKSATAGMTVLPAMAAYLAPEVTSGGLPSVQSDIYSIGVVLYELLTGRTPYHANSAIAMATEHIVTPTPNVCELNPAVPGVLGEIVAMAMAKNPADRYQSVADMLSHLRMQQDAMRFGKPLAWPLAVDPASTDSPKQSQKQPKSQPVAPRMSAIRSDEDAEESRRKAREDRDVPIWMTVAASTILVLLVVTIGAFIALNLTKPKLVTLPNVREMSVDEARTELKRLKLDLKVVRRDPNEKIEQDHILQMEPSPGEKIREGDRVRVVVSSGSKMVAVPDLKGQTIDKAKQVLAVINLEPLIQVMSGTDIRPDSVVLKSDPPARTQVNRFSRIIIVVGDESMLQAPEPAVTPPTVDPGDDSKPPVDAENEFSTSFKVEGKDLDVNVTVDVTDDDGTRTVYNEMNKPGDKLNVKTKSKSPKVTFQIYFDGELIKTEAAGAKR